MFTSKKTLGSGALIGFGGSVILGLLAAACSSEPNDESEAPDTSNVDETEAVPDARIAYREELRTSKGSFSFMKVIDDRGDLRQVVLAADGREVSYAEAADVGIASPIGASLASLIRDRKAGVGGKAQKVKLDLSLRDAIDHEPPEVDTRIEVNVSEGRAWLNGRPATLADIDKATQEKVARATHARQLRDQRRRAHLERLNARERLGFSAERIAELSGTEEPVIVELLIDDAERFVSNNADVVGALDLHAGDETTTLATAMADTWTGNPGAAGLGWGGNNIGVYMTEPGCPPANYLTNYSLLAGSDTDHSRNVSSIIRAVAPEARIYCRAPGGLPTSSDLALTPAIRVVSRSSATTDATGTYTSTDKSWDDFVYNNPVLPIVAAGNSTATCADGTNLRVCSPAKALNVVGVGNYVDSTDTINTSSSRTDPIDTRNDKPELSAPGTSINAGTDVNGNTITMTGTSQATPHVSAMAADLMEAFSWLQARPYQLKAALLKGATDSITGGTGAVGWGGVDFWSMHYNGTWWAYEGANNAFASWDAGDTLPNNGFLDLFFTIPSTLPGKVRVVLSFLTRGTYTFDHRNDSFPLGVDFDLQVFKPNGTSQGGSFMAFNSFEVLTFTPSVSGTYRIRVTLFANRDTASKLHLGVGAGWR